MNLSDPFPIAWKFFAHAEAKAGIEITGASVELRAGGQADDCQATGSQIDYGLRQEGARQPLAPPGWADQ